MQGTITLWMELMALRPQQSLGAVFTESAITGRSSGRVILRPFLGEESSTTSAMTRMVCPNADFLQRQQNLATMSAFGTGAGNFRLPVFGMCVILPRWLWATTDQQITISGVLQQTFQTGNSPCLAINFLFANCHDDH